MMRKVFLKMIVMSGYYLSHGNKVIKTHLHCTDCTQRKLNMNQHLALAGCFQSDVSWFFISVSDLCSLFSSPDSAYGASIF